MAAAVPSASGSAVLAHDHLEESQREQEEWCEPPVTPEAGAQGCVADAGGRSDQKHLDPVRVRDLMAEKRQRRHDHRRGRAVYGAEQRRPAPDPLQPAHSVTPDPAEPVSAKGSGADRRTALIVPGIPCSPRTPVAAGGGAAPLRGPATRRGNRGYEPGVRPAAPVVLGAWRPSRRSGPGSPRASRPRECRAPGGWRFARCRVRGARPEGFELRLCRRTRATSSSGWQVGRAGVARDSHEGFSRDAWLNRSLNTQGAHPPAAKRRSGLGPSTDGRKLTSSPT